MSDHQVGPGWWLASDGKWYPPDQAPSVPPPETWATPPPGPPPRGGMSAGAITALVIACVLGVGLLVGTAALLASSGSDSTEDGPGTTLAVEEVAAPEIPEGYEQADGDGVSIAVPAGWTVLDAEDVSMTPEELEEAFPDAPPEAVRQEAAMFEKGAVLVAFDLADEAFSSNVNILRFPIEDDLATIGEQAEQQIETLGGRVTSSRDVTLPVGPARRVAYEAEVTLPDGTLLPARGVQHYVPIDGDTYVITVTTAGDAEALSDTMMETFRVE